MALDPALARISKILVDGNHVTYDEAQSTLRNLRLHIVVGRSATSPAAQAAILTIVAAGLRTFAGGIRLSGAVDVPLVTSLPVDAPTLGDAAVELGAGDFDGAATQTILVGAGTDDADVQGIRTWWRGWRAGASTDNSADREIAQTNPLVGIAGGALAVAAAFQAARTAAAPELEIDLWPATADAPAPGFNEIFLPSSIWMVGLGNLGQAYLWALSALPYADPSKVTLVLQDHDRVTDENWATSILVRRTDHGKLKNQIGERWAGAKGFSVRRLDRRLLPHDRLDDDDPRLALSGVDKIAVRRLLIDTGFDCVVDAGLGMTSDTFDRFRITVFDKDYRPETHFKDIDDPARPAAVPANEAYQALEKEIGTCGTVEIAGASAAAPFVSALAATIAVTRAIAIASGRDVLRSEVGRALDSAENRCSPAITPRARGIGHAGRPSP